MRCASLALAPLPLISPYKSEASSCGAGHRGGRCSRCHSHGNGTRCRPEQPATAACIGAEGRASAQGDYVVSSGSCGGGVGSNRPCGANEPDAPACNDGDRRREQSGGGGRRKSSELARVLISTILFVVTIHARGGGQVAYALANGCACWCCGHKPRHWARCTTDSPSEQRVQSRARHPRVAVQTATGRGQSCVRCNERHEQGAC
eukprot:COSAG03_NODE_24_length_19454_cov_271.127667_7_plen_205_part_00